MERTVKYYTVKCNMKHVLLNYIFFCRTVSADSGCDVNTEMVTNTEPNPAILEETVRIWANRFIIHNYMSIER